MAATPLLVQLLALARDGASITVTLSTRGAIVSGMGTEWIAAALEEAPKTKKQGEPGIMERLLKKAGQDFEQEIEVARLSTLPPFVYLGDALLFVGGRQAPVGLWACDLADVTGFALGKIVVSSD